ncbi:MAG: hypothetical protein U0W24_21315 [Bacteroidales bacterium]
MFCEAQKKSGTNPWSMIRTQPHYFAVHVPEPVENLCNVKVIMGHESSKTTWILHPCSKCEN